MISKSLLGILGALSVNVGMADPTDYARHREVIPYEEFHFGQHKLSVGPCSVYRWNGANHIIVRKEVTGQAGRPWHTIISFDLPSDINKLVAWNTKPLKNRADISEVQDHSVALEYDVTRYYNDTFGYYARQQATILLNPNGTLRSVSAKDLTSDRVFVVAGWFKPFQVREQIDCME